MEENKNGGSSEVASSIAAEKPKQTTKASYEPPKPHESRTVELPSGKTAVIRHGIGRDLMNAQRTVGVKNSDDIVKVMFALIAELATIDGAQPKYEDVLEMDLMDVLTLQGEVVGGNFKAAGLPMQ